MELKEFVEQVLVQVAQGVKASKEPVQSAGMCVNNPAAMSMSPAGDQWVDFDVGLTVESRGSAKAGLGVVGGVLAMGGSGEKGHSETSVSRVKFRVHLAPI